MDVARTLIALVALLVGPGCVVATYGRYSRATLEDPDAVARTEGQVTWFGERDGDTFQLRDAHVQLIAMNEQVVVSIWGIIVPFLPLPGWDNASEVYSETLASPPAFLLLLRLRPKRSGLDLRPDEVLLRRADGTLARPRGFWGVSEDSHCRGFALAPTPSPPQPLPGAAHAIAGGEEACVTWLFDGPPPDPGESFALEQSGTREGSGPWLRGTIRFEPDSSWTFEWVLLF